MDKGIVLTTLISVGLVAVCVTIHYEALRLLARRAAVPGQHRWLILGSIFGALFAHVCEIWIFGAGYWTVVEVLELGTLVPEVRDSFDYVYYSAMVYTTVGFGDLVPEGAVRMITSTEALMGLSMITWTASFSYLQMQRIWVD